MDALCHPLTVYPSREVEGPRSDDLASTWIKRLTGTQAGGYYALLWVKDGIVYSITGQGNKQAAVDLANSIP